MTDESSEKIAAPKKDFTERVSPFLTVLFYGMLASVPISFLFELSDRYHYEPNGLLAGLLFLVFGLGIVLTVVLFLVFVPLWVFHFHKEMKKISPAYEISRWGSVGRMFIPIYNLFGIYEIIKKAAIEIKGAGEQGLRDSFFIERSLPVFYALFWISNILGKIVLKDSFKKNLDPDMGLLLNIASTLIDLPMYFLWLKIFEKLNAGLQNLKKTKGLLS